MLKILIYNGIYLCIHVVLTDLQPPVLLYFYITEYNSEVDYIDERLAG